MKIKVGKLDVLDSGSVVGNINESIDFELNGDLIKVVRFVFEDDESNKKQKVLAKLSENEKQVVEIVFTNYNNILGIGNTKPLPLNTYSGRKLFLNYRIFHLENAGKHIHYTLLLGKEGNDE